jgi:hypothetical protein
VRSVSQERNGGDQDRENCHGERYWRKAGLMCAVFRLFLEFLQLVRHLLHLNDELSSIREIDERE